MERFEQNESKLSKIIWLDEFCKQMNVTVKTGKRWVKQRKIAHIKSGTKIGFLPEHIEEFLKSISVPAVTKRCLTVEGTVSEMKLKILQKKNSS